MLSWLSLLFIFLLAFGSYSQIDTTEEYKALGYPDGRKIVRDSEGNLYVAYRKKYTQHKVETYHVFVAKSTDGGQKWQVTNDNSPIERVGDYSQRVPAIAIDGKDTLHVVWYGNDASNTGTNERQIKYSRSADGGRTWSDWQNIAEVQGYDDGSLWQEHPTIYADGQNKLYVAWQGKDRDHNRSQVKFSMSADGGASWTSWINVNPSKKSSYSRPTILAHAGGGLYILAYGGDGDPQQIVWTRSEDGGRTWSAWRPVAAGDCDQRHVSADIDSQGRLHAAWRQRPCGAGDDAPSQVHYAMFDGDSWSDPVVPGPEPDMYQVFPSIEVTADREVWLVWSENDHASGYPSENPGSGSIVYVFHSGSGWSSRNVVRETAKAVFPSLGRHLPDAGSRVDLVWLVNADAADNSIHYQRLK